MDSNFNKQIKIDYLIVGQGIAGTMMAYHLIKAGKRILVVDNGVSSSSMIAGGLFNPVTGRRFVKSWLIDELLPCAETVYKDMEVILGKKLLYKLPIVKYLSGEEEKEVYERSIQDDKKKYIAGFTASESGNKYASCEIKGGGYIDTLLLITAFRKYLDQQHSFVESNFAYNDIIINELNIVWGDFQACSIIFCEGYRATENPYFPGLPFNLAKGEILTVRIPGLYAENILMSTGYLVPVGNDIYKMGSTYEWDDLTTLPTEKGRKELIGKLKKITELPFEILNHEAGIRPAVKQRRPLLGKSHINDKMFILNGLGTKGVILAPYFALQLAEYILQGKPIEKDVDINFS